MNPVKPTLERFSQLLDRFTETRVGSLVMRRPLTCLFASSLLVHLVVVAVLDPFARTRMVFDLNKAEHVAAAVQGRANQRREEERQRRAQLSLPEDQREELKEQAQRREERQMRTRIQKMLEARERGIAQREEAFQKLRERDKKEYLRKHVLDPTKRALERIAELAELHKDALPEEKKSERQRAEDKRAEEAIERMRDAIAAVDREFHDPTKTEVDLSELLKQIAKTGEELRVVGRNAEPRRDENDANLSQKLSQEGSRFAQSAEALQKQIEEAEKLNDTSTASVIADAPAAAVAAAASQPQTENEQNPDIPPKKGGMGGAQDPKAASASGARQEKPPVQAARQEENQATANQGGSQGTRQQAGGQPSLADLYEAAVEIEKQVATLSKDIRAAEHAVRSGVSFPTAQSVISIWSPPRPDLAAELRKNQAATVEELNQYRDTVRQASIQMQNMASRTQSLTSQMDNILGRHRNSPPLLSSAIASSVGSPGAPPSRAEGVPLVQGAAGGTGEGVGDSHGGGRVLDVGVQSGLEYLIGEAQARLPESLISAQALPGRVFTEESARKGWLYLDTWYVIGPWQAVVNRSFTTPHPPEQVIDFDAEYRDGKFAQEDGHPDQVLRWQFLQSDGIRIQPPRIYGAATYFFYTEVFFDRDREMVVAIGADDAAQIWVNGKQLLDRPGQTAFRLGDTLLPVTFHKGFNTVLVRLENYPGTALFSVLLCPAEAVRQYLTSQN